MKVLSIKNSIKFILLIAISITLGNAIALMPGFSAGAWVRNLAPAAFFGVLFLLHQIGALPIKGSDWLSILKLPDKLNLSVKVVLFLISLAVIIGLTLTHYGFGLTITLSFLLAGAGILISVILIATGKRAAGLSLIIITLSVVNFLEYEFRVFHKAYHGVLFIMPSIIILWVIGFLFLLIHLSMKRSFVSTPFNKVWLIIFIPMLLSATFSSDYILSFRHVFYFLSISIPFFLAVNTIKSTEELRLCTISLALAAGLRLITLSYFEMAKMSAGFTYQVKVFGSLPSYYSVLGLSIALCFFLSIGLISSERANLKRCLLTGVVTGLLVITFLKLSRSGAIALSSGVLVLLFYRKVRPWAIVVLIASILAVFLSLDWIKEYTALGRFELNHFSSIESIIIHHKMRVDAYQAALSIIKDFPLFGIGPGMWDEYYFRYMKNPIVWFIQGVPEIQYVRSAHNIFLQHGAISGIPGLISMIILAYIMMKNLILLYRSQHVALTHELSMALIAITISVWLMWTLGGGSFEIKRSPEVHFWFWLFLGLIAASRNIQDKKTS